MSRLLPLLLALSLLPVLAPSLADPPELAPIPMALTLDRSIPWGAIDGISVVHDYGGALLVRIDDPVAAAPYAAALRPLPFVHRIAVNDLQWQVGSHPQIPARWSATGGSAALLQIVHIAGPIDGATLDQLGAIEGVRILFPLADTALLVSVEPESLAAVEALPMVDQLDPYHPYLRVSPPLREAAGTQHILVLLRTGPSGTLVDPRDVSDVLSAIEADGGSGSLVDPDGLPLVEAWLDASSLPMLAAQPAVLWVEADQTALLEALGPPLDRAAWVIQSNRAADETLWDHGLTGLGQIMGNADTGLGFSNPAFFDPNESVPYSDPASPTGPNLNHRKVVNYWTFGDGVDDATFGYHGTHSTGTNAGDDRPLGGSGQFKGMAPEARLSFQDVWSGGGLFEPADFGDVYAAAASDGAFVHSGSLSCFPGGAYSVTSAQMDQYLYANPQFLAVIANHNYATGNDPGSVCDKASAKDTLSIGAVDNAPSQDQMMSYSGHGPTTDGRIKPTISTPTNVISPGFDGGGAPQNSSFGGTSAATPVAAGGMVLARQYFTDGFFPSGTATPTDGFVPTAALLRAVAIASTREAQGASAHGVPYNTLPFPNNDQGFGRLTLDDALYFAGDSRQLLLQDDSTGVGTGESVEEPLAVDAGMALKVALVWTDPAAVPGGNAPKLINDLDLRVIGPDGAVYSGNNFRLDTDHQSASGEVPDTLNTEELVLLTSPAAGAYRVEVWGIDVSFGSSQPFALVITGAVSSGGLLSLVDGSLSATPSDLTVGDEVTLSATFTNAGPIALPTLPMELRIDDEVIDDASVALGPGQTVSLSGTWVATGGHHQAIAEGNVGPAVSSLSTTADDGAIPLWVNVPPTAALHANRTVAQTAEPFTFDASESVDDGPLQYTFDLGDGSAPVVQALPLLVASYADDGLYNVTVQVQDNRTLQALAITQVEVRNRDPVAVIGADPISVLTLEDVLFDGEGSSDADGEVALQFDFGDGTFGNTTLAVPQVLHQFADDGQYLVRLVVTDDDGAQALAMTTVSVANRPPAAVLELPLTDLDVQTPLTGSAVGTDLDGEIVLVTWDLGDGTILELQGNDSLSYTYATLGEFRVFATVTDDDGATATTSSMTVEVRNLPPSVSPFLHEAQPQLSQTTMHFDANATDPEGDLGPIRWAFGDGKIATGAVVTHAYEHPGTYDVSVLVYDSLELTAAATLEVEVGNRLPIAQIDTVATNLTIGDWALLHADHSIDADGKVRTYRWEALGRTYNGETLNLSLLQVGDIVVTLEVEDDSGGTNATSMTLRVLPLPKAPAPQGTPLSGMLPWMGLLALIVAAAIVALLLTRRRRAPPQPAPSQPPAPWAPPAAPIAPSFEATGSSPMAPPASSPAEAAPVAPSFGALPPEQGSATASLSMEQAPPEGSDGTAPERIEW